MISRTAQYALRILGALAEQPEQWVQGEQLASSTGIPANYLSKILSQLRKGGLVHSQKGWGGGFMLDRQALGVPIAEVVQLFDGQRDESACVFGLPRCDPEHPCPLHPYWETIAASYDRMLEGVTIGQLKEGWRVRA